MGISTANSASFVTDEVVAGANAEYPDREDRIANLTSGLRNMMLGFGQCFGALSGAVLRKVFGMQHALEIMSLVYLLLGIYGIV